MMKSITKILALLMVLIMAFCMVACGSDSLNTTTENTTDATTRPTNDKTEPSTEPDDGKVDYVIIVKDSEGNPVPGVLVNVCMGDMCFLPCNTDENGSATTRLEESSEYYGSVTSDPSTKVYFEDKFEVTIVWDAPEAE